jgi:UDP-4-amino-4,6-dideoxy-N-acetyl-beta-L-altrosamine transaminase
MIPYGQHNVTQADINEVITVLQSDFLTQGPIVPKFETALATYCGASKAVAANSATSALHIACLSLGLGPNDVMWTSANSFVASANCGLYCGATVDFIDIDPNTYNISIDQLQAKLAKAEIDGNLPKIVIPVHMCGLSCNMAAIFKLSQQYGFKIIEDASHAIGGEYLNGKIGNCRFSDITVFSFHPVKIITTGEGGVALTNDPILAERMVRFRSHGISSNPAMMETRPDDEIWNYQQSLLGFNYRMTDIQAALGISQLQRIDQMINARHTIAHQYNEQLSGLNIQLPHHPDDCYSSYHLYAIRITKNSKLTQREIYNKLQSLKVNVNVHYIPIYRQPFYEKLGFKAGYCLEAEQYHKETISLPIYPSLTSTDLQYVIKHLRSALT